MKISKTRFINWTRCPMYFPMDLKHNPKGELDIDAEREERNKEAINEIMSSISSEGYEDDEEEYDGTPSEELKALLPYYNQVEDEALKVAKKFFKGEFQGDSQDVHNQKLFEYDHNGHTYRCYVDIYNENDEEINIIEVKATTSSRYMLTYSKDGNPKGLYFMDKAKNGNKYPLFMKEGNIWRLNTEKNKVTEFAEKNFKEKRAKLLDRYAAEGKYPYDLAFQRYVIEHALRKEGDMRKVNFYLAVLNKEYVYDGALDEEGKRVYNTVEGQELITFYDMNEVTAEYQDKIRQDVATLESYISTVHDTGKTVPVGKWCAWETNTECVFCKHCFQVLRAVPDHNRSNNYKSFRGFKDRNIKDKYQLINEGYYKMDDVPIEWLKSENHKIQRHCYETNEEHVDKEKMEYWLGKLEYPIYHFDFEGFPCPLPLFKGENPYRQSVFEFSLHIEREPGVCDKEKDNFVFLNKDFGTDEREELAKAIVEHFKFNEDGTLHGTMLAQNTSYEMLRLKELAKLYPQYSKKLLAIRDKSADLIDLLSTHAAFYSADFPNTAKNINYYHRDLSGSYSIKKTLPVLVPDLSYDDMKKHTVGNGVQAYVTYINYDAKPGTTRKMNTKEERREALRIYCQQDTWAMVEILRAVRKKLEEVSE